MVVGAHGHRTEDVDSVHIRVLVLMLAGSTCHLEVIRHEASKLADPAHGLRGRAGHQPRHDDRQRRAAEHLRELDAGTRQLQWVVDGYNLAFAALVLAAGSLSDRYGRRPALIVGLVGFAAASAAGALVSSAGALVPPASRWARSPR